MRKAHSDLFSLDVLALSLLCCLLGSVVAILVLSGEGSTTRERVELGKNTSQMMTSLGETRNSLEEISGKLHFAAMERENREAEDRIEELEGKIQARRKIADAQSEIARLATQVQEGKHKKPEHTGQVNVFGSYTGPYVLIDCVKDHAVAYPGAERIPLTASPLQISQLIRRIQTAGFVLFTVRPSGWFQNSYDKLMQLMKTQLDQSRSSNGNPIGVATLPLEENASLSHYLPSAHAPSGT